MGKGSGGGGRGRMSLSGAQANSLSIVKELRGKGLSRDEILSNPAYKQAKRLEQRAANRNERVIASSRSLNGYENTLSPAGKARAISLLTTNRTVGGKQQTLRDFVRGQVSSGARVGTREGQAALITKGGSYYRQREITKIAINYASYLIG